ncbi:GNAT family N-acetyltransferase [bacterium]|nr:GNAT family N-acetyltransferase [bacterium]
MKKKKIIIKTERLILTPLDRSYLDTFDAYSRDEENSKYLLVSKNRTREDSYYYLYMDEKAWLQNPPINLDFAIIFENIHVGSISLHIYDDLKLEIGWIIDRNHQRKGIAYEAAKALIEYMRNLGHNHFIAHTDTRNYPSYHLMEKLGFKRTNISERVYPDERGIKEEYEYELIYN